MAMTNSVTCQKYEQQKQLLVAFSQSAHSCEYRSQGEGKNVAAV